MVMIWVGRLPYDMESVTKAISCDAGPEEIKTKVNAILPSFRSIEVEKLASSKHRHEWLITFPSEMGDIGMLIGDPNWLQGDGKDVIITEHVTGVTDMVGSFRLGLDAYTWTHGLRPDATAVEVENAIKGLEGVKNCECYKAGARPNTYAAKSAGDAGFL